MSERHAVVIGGGFTGAATAIALTELTTQPLSVTLVEPRSVPGAGVAYSTPDPAHRINVPASRMQLAGRPENDFDSWFRARDAFKKDPLALTADGSVYPQRAQFGLYVANQYARAVQRSGGRLKHVHQSAVEISGKQVTTSNGERITADVIILATSHPPPVIPSRLLPYDGHPALIANPWKDESLAGIHSEARVLVMGNGLTMVDVVASLTHRGHHGPIVAFSRHGLLPQPNLNGNFPEWQGNYQQGTLREQMRHVRSDIAEAAGQGIPWQRVLDSVRQQGQTFWQQLTHSNQQRFLRHVRRYWDVHRYRIAPQLAAVIEARCQKGSLIIAAARLVDIQPVSEGKLQVELTSRAGQSSELTIDNLILTTGPAHSQLIHSQPLLAQLAVKGDIRSDSLGLGIAVNSQSQALGRDDKPTPGLFIAGPAARGRFGELMGLPQVADHAALVAKNALAWLAGNTGD